jgi:hypothetical protein
MRLPSTPGNRFALPIAAVFLLAGCDPIINIAGANFPAILTAVIRPVFVVTRVEPYLWPLPIVYLSLAILMGCTVWLIFFNKI